MTAMVIFAAIKLPGILILGVIVTVLCFIFLGRGTPWK